WRNRLRALPLISVSYSPLPPRYPQLDAHLTSAACAWSYGPARERGRLGHPLYHLGLLARPPRQESLNRRDRIDNLLIRHRLDPAGVLDFHFARHQHRANFQIRGRRLAPNSLKHLAPMLLPVLRQIE